MASENVRLYENKLELRNLQRGDMGIYTCQAQNPAGQSSVDVQLNYMGRKKLFPFTLMSATIVIQWTVQQTCIAKVNEFYFQSKVQLMPSSAHLD